MAREPVAKDVWTTGAAYEAYVGRWSRLVAAELVRWLGVPPRSRWLDVGCDSGALAEAILERAAPHLVLGVDRSKGFVAHTSARLAGARIQGDETGGSRGPRPGGMSGRRDAVDMR